MRLKNIPFRLESELFKAWYRCSRTRPSSRPFVSGDSFRSLADHVLEPGSQIDPRSVAPGDIVFVQASEIERFGSAILSRLVAPFVLVTHNGDLNIDERYSVIANNSRLLHWFAQNLIFRHPKLTAIPIGLENRFLHSNGVISDFKHLSRRRSAKINRILYGFTVENNPAEREPAEDALRESSLADCPTRLNGRGYRKLLERYGFVASPPGNGVDCHRTWEALYLGVVPILKKSMVYELLPPLPALFVDDWRQVSIWDTDFLVRARETLTPQIESLPCLRFDYWRTLIQNARGMRSYASK
jgi:hypothetical protein